MPCNYEALAIMPLRFAAYLGRPEQSMTKQITLQDDAVKVMTDLMQISAVTISPSASLDEAVARMINMGVKLLFVTDSKERVIGLTTYTDTQGERPMQFQQHNNLPRSEICVLDIMTGMENVDILEMQAVQKAKVGDIVMTMKKLQRQHALVLDEFQGMHRIRGIFSTTQIGKQLGIELETSEIAQTFAQMEKLLNC